MDEETRRNRELDALENLAEEAEKLRVLKEYELGVKVVEKGGDPDVKPAEER